VSNLFVDVETRCAVPIERGYDLYTRAAECMIITFAVDERPVVAIDLMDPFEEIPNEFMDAYQDERVQKVAHNSPFDWGIFQYAQNLKKYGDFRTPVEQWFDTQSCAYSHGLPGSLETLGIVLGLPQDQQKLSEDSKLIHTFCVPYDEEGHYVEPYDEWDKWCKFVNYAIRDTAALREIYRRLPKHNYRHVK
jgi:DNA polymerase bacteriophage-type